MTGAEARIDGPSGLRVVIQSGGDRESGGILLEGGPGLADGHWDSRTALSWRRHNLNPAQADVAIVSTSGSAVGQAGIGHGFKAQGAQGARRGGNSQGVDVSRFVSAFHQQ